MKFPRYKTQEKLPFPTFTFEQQNVGAENTRQTQRVMTARGYRGLTKAQMQALRPFEGFMVVIRFHREVRGGYENGGAIGILENVKSDELELEGIPRIVKRGDIQYVDIMANQTADLIVRRKVGEYGDKSDPNDENYFGIELRHAKSGYKVWIVNNPTTNGMFRANALTPSNRQVKWLGDFRDGKEAEEAGMKWLREGRNNLWQV